jgi:radical SAM superfamily enzyme YgiQ (UPF0313 family)
MPAPRRVYFVIAPLCLERQVLAARHPPLFAAYAIAGVKAAGHEALVRDLYLRVVPLSQVLDEGAAFQPDLVVLVAEDLDRKAPISESHKLARALKTRLPGVPIALTGSSSVSHFSKALDDNPAIDFAWLGETDEAIAEWLDAAPEARPTLSGVLSRTDRGLRCNGVTAPKDLDRLPWPDWEAVRFGKYRQAPHRRRGRRSYIIVTSRGCPYRCTFCEEITYFAAVSYRQRSVASVLREMREVSARYPDVEFSFQDAVFGLDQAWAVEFCARLRRELPQAVWSAITRADLCTPELLKAMSEAGCYNILVGLESAKEETLRALKKFNITRQTARDFVRLARENGIEVTTSFMIGLPNETREDIRKTVDFAIDLDPDYAQFIVHKHFGNTRPFDGLGTYEEEWDFTPQDMLGPAFVPNTFATKGELRREQWRAYRRFYLRWSYIAKRRGDLLRPGQFRRYLEAVPILAGMAWKSLRDAPGRTAVHSPLSPAHRNPTR